MNIPFILNQLFSTEENRISLLYSYDKIVDIKSLLKYLMMENKNIIEDFLIKWMNIRPYDFTNKNLITYTVKISDLYSSNKLKLLLLKTSALNDERSFYVPNINTHPISISEGYSLINSWKMFMLKNKDDIARWLTYRTVLMYINIKPIELIELLWTKEDNNSIYLVLIQKRFNQLALWFVSIILLAGSIEEQGMIFSMIIQLGKSLYNMNNFYDLGAVFAALNNGNISRLGHIRENLDNDDKSFLNVIDNLFCIRHNSKNYRDHISKLKNIIPFTPLHLKDIFATISNTDYNELDTSDLFMTGSVIKSYLKYQEYWYNQHIKIEIRHWEVIIAYLSDEDMETLSDRWKSINKQSNIISESKNILTNSPIVHMLKRKASTIKIMKRKRYSNPPTFDDNLHENPDNINNRRNNNNKKKMRSRSKSLSSIEIPKKIPARRVSLNEKFYEKDKLKNLLHSF